MAGDKQQLLSKLLEGVKCCQSRFGSRTELATEDEESVRKLCVAYEDVLLNGIKGKGGSGAGSGKSRWQMENFVPSGLRGVETPSFWSLVKSQLSKHEAERFLLLHNVRTDFGRGRAWLRAALNEHSLERYILMFLSLENLFDYYEPHAFLLDPELSTILPQTAAGLGSVLFALRVDNPMLDAVTRPVVSKSDNVASPVEVAEVADQFLAAMVRESPTSNYHEATQSHKTNSKKKKKKPHLNVVSFDDDGQSETAESGPAMTMTCSSSSMKSSHSGSSASNATTPTPTATPTPTTTPLDRKPSLPLPSSPVQISPQNNKSQSQAHQSHQNEDPIPDISIYSSSLKSMDCISVNSAYSDCSERLDLSFDLNFGNVRLKPVSDRSSATAGGTAGDSDPNNENDLDSCSQDLIPVPNFDPSTSTTAPEIQLEEDLDLSCMVMAAPTSRTSASTSKNLTMEIQGSGGGASKTRLNESLTDAKHSNLSYPYASIVSNTNEEDNEKISQLKTVLDREIETVTTLQAQLAEDRRKSTDQIKILEVKVDSLSKENEILRHQLNKYIGAVQMLKKERGLNKSLGRRGSSFEESDDVESLLDQVEDRQNEVSDDGAEYERKLIQVAEMHGELMEFNTHLQCSLRKRDLVIRRLKEELVDLRGPLAAPFLGEEAGFDDDSWDIVDSGNSFESGSPSRRQIQLTHNERVLINIWIPSAFLTGAKADLHHVYQVFLRIKDTEWNVYRRYSQFYSLHRDLKKRDPVVGSFYFPPKKHVGNKDGKFVDERRRKLQDYLRKVMNHTLQTNSILAAHPDKNLLISIFPFFGENTFVASAQKKKERSRARNLFFLSTSSNNSQGQVRNSPSGFQTQVAYPQYTGL